MGRKTDRMYMEQLLAAIRAANQPSQWETQLGNERNQLQSWLDAKDYRNLPNGVNIDMLPLAEAQRMRKMVRGSGGTGQRAAGADGGRILAAQKEFGDNQFAQDWSGAYEQKVGDLMGRKDTLTQLLMGQSDNRSNNNVRNQSLMLDAYRNRPKGGFLQSLLPGLIQGGASIAGAFI